MKGCCCGTTFRWTVSDSTLATTVSVKIPSNLANPPRI